VTTTQAGTNTVISSNTVTSKIEMINSNKLSKVISHALRHEPEKYNIVLDKDGWVNINSLLKGIQENIHEYQDLVLDDIFKAVNASRKKRHEIKNHRIRAIYGHSTEIEMGYIERAPPDFLYHGTSEDASKIILLEGLKPMQRKYVHLSPNIRTAITVGGRKERSPVVLTIAAEKAYSCGVTFYFGNDDTWLTKFVPSKFIEKTEV